MTSPVAARARAAATRLGSCATAWPLGVAALAAAASLGCAPKPKESKVARDVKIVNEENEPQKLFERGKAFHSVGDLTRAEQYYAAAMQTGYPVEKVLPLLLRVCIEGGRLQVAIDYATPVLKKSPADHKLRLVLASLYSATGQHAVARGHYEKVVADRPDDPAAHYALAVLLRDEFRDLAGADRHFREYLRVSPDGPHAEEAKGSLLKDVSTTPVVQVVPVASAATSASSTSPPAKSPPASGAASTSPPTPLPPKPASSAKPTPVKHP